MALTASQKQRNIQKLKEKQNKSLLNDFVDLVSLLHPHLAVYCFGAAFVMNQ